MSRARKTAPTASGMNWLEILPPALSPWNWWGAPLAAVQNTHAMLDAWRSSADSMRAAVRSQQDAFCALCEASLSRASETKPEAANADAANDEAKAEVADFVTPMMEASRAYGRVGRAFIVAQRNSMRAFTRTDQPN